MRRRTSTLALGAVAAVLATLLAVRVVDRAPERPDACHAPQQAAAQLPTAAAAGGSARRSLAPSRAETHSDRFVRGRVVDRGGIPLSHATIRITLHVATDQPNYVTTDAFEAGVKADADGRFEATVPRHGKYLLRAEAEGFASAQRDWVNPGDDVELSLDPGGRIFGRVILEETGQPVAAARIALHFLEAPSYLLGETLTDSNGGFSFAGLPGGSWGLATRRPGSVDAWDNVALEVGGTAVREIRLQPGLCIAGRIVESGTGQPIDVARVTASDQLVTTDPAGRFRLTGLVSKLYEVHASAKGWAPLSYAVDLDRNRALQDLELSLVPAPTVSGVVVDETGRPLERVSVASWQETVETAADGRFTVTVGPSDRSDARQIVFQRTGFSRHVLDVTALAGLSTVVLQPADARIAGVVRDEHGEPVAGARVEGATREEQTEFARCGATGTDQLGAFAFEGLDRRRAVIWVRATAPGHGAVEKNFGRESRGSVQILLPTLASLTVTVDGVVVDESGAGIPGANVSMDAGDVSVNTSSDGRFRLVTRRVNRDADAFVFARARGFSTNMAWVRLNRERVTITLRRVGSVHARLVNADTGKPFRRLDLEVVSGSPAGPVRIDNGTGDVSFETTPGYVCVRILPGTRGYSRRVELAGDVVAGQVLDLGTIPVERAGGLEGVIIPAPGQSPRRIGILVRRAPDRPWRCEGQTDSTGWYGLEGLAEGLYEVVAADPGVADLQKSLPVHCCSIGSVLIVAGKRARLDGQLNPPATLTVALSVEARAGEEVLRHQPGIGTPSEIWLESVQGQNSCPDPDINLEVTSLDGLPVIWEARSEWPTATLGAVWQGKGLSVEFPVRTLHAGEYRLSLQTEGRTPVEKTVRLAVGQEERVTMEMALPQAPGKR